MKDVIGPKRDLKGATPETLAKALLCLIQQGLNKQEA